MRLLLSVAVVSVHTIPISYGSEFTNRFVSGGVRPFSAVILPMFFGLGGFLVAGSLNRCRTLVSFAGLRLIRLVPALALETTLSALVFGPWFTKLPLSAYFASPIFHAYFANMIGDVHFTLPGVFEKNPLPNIVNGQLWTLPVDLLCYISLCALAALRILRFRWLFLGVIVALNARWVFINLMLWVHAAPAFQPPEMPTYALVLAFLYGVCLHMFRSHVKIIPSMLWASVALTFLFLYIPFCDFLAVPAVVYITVYLGICNPRPLSLIKSGDYSYGIYLYGFPVQQAVAATMGAAGASWYINLLVSLPLICGFAAISWWLVEKPALRLRSLLFTLEERAFRPRRQSPAPPLQTRSTWPGLLQAAPALIPNTVSIHGETTPRDQSGG